MVENLPEVDDELFGRSGAVGQLELFKLAQLDEVGQAGRGQLRTAWGKIYRRFCMKVLITMTMVTIV